MMKKFVTEIQVRFRDIDSMGHVNNAVYMTYFEEGRKEFVRPVLGMVKSEDYSFILAHIECDFLRPILISDTVSLEVWIGEIGTKRFDFLYQLLKKGAGETEWTVCAKGRSVQVYFDYQQNVTIPIPPDIRDKLAQYTGVDLENQQM